jgi:hypothetical protein
MTTSMETNQTPVDKPSPTISVVHFLPSAIFLIVVGWGGLYALIQLTSPNGGTRWLFFCLLIMGVTGLILPLAAWLNARFPSSPPVTNFIVIRQALWGGVFMAIVAWLQIGRVLNPAMALLLAVGLIIIEWLLRLRERSQWKP